MRPSRLRTFFQEMSGRHQMQLSGWKTVLLKHSTNPRLVCSLQVWPCLPSVLAGGMSQKRRGLSGFEEGQIPQVENICCPWEHKLPVRLGFFCQRFSRWDCLVPRDGATGGGSWRANPALGEPAVGQNAMSTVISGGHCNTGAGGEVARRLSSGPWGRRREGVQWQKNPSLSSLSPSPCLYWSHPLLTWLTSSDTPRPSLSRKGGLPRPQPRWFPQELQAFHDNMR